MELNFYEQIAANKRKSMLLFVMFFGFIIGLGLIFGFLLGNPLLGAIIAGILAAIVAFFSYRNAENIVLRASNAKPVTKEEYPYLYNTVEALSIGAGIPTPKCYVIEDDAPNAFAAGRSPETAVVCVTTGLLQKMNRVELEGVIAHEISHIKNNDVRTMTLAVVLVGVVTLLSDLILYSFIWGDLGRNVKGRFGIILVLVGFLLALLAPLIATLIKFAISRQREYLADASAAKLTRYPEGLASALEKIANDSAVLKSANKATAHLYISNPLKGRHLFDNLFSTHPPIEERIRRLRAM